jgi:trans-2,3-dihydro-3-hydroxyanthranilate isomerase
MIKIPIKQVDAFTRTPLTGNPAGVVVNADGLTDKQMQTIAREMSVPETAFILSPSVPGADIRIRWFTPTTEVPLCGHATVAAFHALAEEGAHGMKEPGSYAFSLETRSGILPVNVEKADDGIDVLFGLNVPEFVRAGQYKLDLMRILNISLEEFENRMPIVVADYVYVPIRRLHTIFSMKPNFFAMAQFLSNRSLGGLCAFTTETVDKGSHVHSRFFAPTVGINEDPVTGSANGPLGAYLFERGEVEPVNGVAHVIGEQGDVIGRKGRVSVRVTVEGTQVTGVHIGGRAVTVVEGEMMIG